MGAHPKCRCELSLGTKLSKSSKIGASSEGRVSCLLLVTFTRLEILLVSFPDLAVSPPPLPISSLLSPSPGHPSLPLGLCFCPLVTCSPSLCTWQRSPRLGESMGTGLACLPSPARLHCALPVACWWRVFGRTPSLVG